MKGKGGGGEGTRNQRKGKKILTCIFRPLPRSERLSAVRAEAAEFLSLQTGSSAETVEELAAEMADSVGRMVRRKEGEEKCLHGEERGEGGDDDGDGAKEAADGVAAGLADRLNKEEREKKGEITHREHVGVHTSSAASFGFSEREGMNRKTEPKNK